MGDKIFIVRVVGQGYGQRQWFVDKDWAEDLFYSLVDNKDVMHLVELIQVDMDLLIDYALDDLLDGQSLEEEDSGFVILQSNS